MGQREDNEMNVFPYQMSASLRGWAPAHVYLVEAGPYQETLQGSDDTTYGAFVSRVGAIVTSRESAEVGVIQDFPITRKSRSPLADVMKTSMVCNTVSDLDFGGGINIHR